MDSPLHVTCLSRSERCRRGLLWQVPSTLLRRCAFLRPCALLLGFVTTAGCLATQPDGPTPGPTPVPPGPVTPVAQGAIKRYATGLARSFRTAADQLDQGTLQSAADTQALLQAQNIAARQQAFTEVDQRIEAAIGGERWNTATASTLFRELAHELEGAP